MSTNETTGDMEQQIPTSEVDQNKKNEETSKRHRKLYEAARKGNWNKAEEIFKKNPEDVLAELSYEGNTAIHVAAEAGRNDFVKEMLRKYGEKHDLFIENDECNTAFSIAAMSGNTELAKLMLEKNGDLVKLRNGWSEMLPIQMAALLGHEKMVMYLYAAIKDDKSGFVLEDRIELLVILIDNDLYDVALLMVKDFPELATDRSVKCGYGETALHALARKPLTYHYSAYSEQGILKRFYYKVSGTNITENKTMHPKALRLVKLLWEKVEKQLDNYQNILKLIEEPSNLIIDAAKEGNADFLSILIGTHPDLVSKVVDEDGYNIFHIAISYRHENIFKLIYETHSIKNVIFASAVEEENNILHLVAKLPPDLNRIKVVPGAALQMQRELVWFKEMSNLMPPIQAVAKIENGKTARALFTESHKNLMKEGEEWMKKTAESCMIVATLIATIVFAATFTLPGGVKDDNGAPHFLKKASFMIFVVSDTISLVSSSCSILTFLSILTARYAEEDFFWSLPFKLLLGLFTLFVSVIGMMAVFCTTLFIVFDEGTIGPAVAAAALSAIPIIMFILQQNRLFLDVVRLMSLRDSLFKKTQSNILLFKKKQAEKK